MWLVDVVEVKCVVLVNLEEKFSEYVNYAEFGHAIKQHGQRTIHVRHLSSTVFDTTTL